MEELIPKLVLVFAIFAVAGAQSPPPYTNHTVGDTAGWFLNATTGTPSANYSAWAQSLTFDLGDYLIFRTNTNYTVVQTYNQTAYADCDVGDDESEGDVSVYSGGQGFGVPVVLSVPLTKVGPNYYFSEADDGDQCDKGMRFEIKVNQGRGLPPSLNQPPPPQYVDPAQTPPASPSPPGSGGDEPANHGLPSSFAQLGLVGFISLVLSGYLLI